MGPGHHVYLMTDVVGSTRAWELYPDQMRAAMARHDELIATAVAGARGRTLRERGEGDSTFSVFGDEIDAVRGAIALQRALATEPWPAPVEIVARAAIHAGPAEERDGDFYGSAVNRTARLRACGHGGQVLVSGVVCDAVGDRLGDTVTFVDLGRHRLRDLSEPERVFQVRCAGLRDRFPPLTSLDPRHHNLPAPPTELVGRDLDIARVAASLDDPNNRIVSITGPGGVGKSRLAVRVAGEVLSGFEGGAWLVELAGLDDPDQVPGAIAGVLGVEPLEGETETDAVLRALTSRGRTLLILDNVEHLIECATWVARLVADTPTLQVLTTTQVPLEVRAERRQPLGPLTVPEPAAADQPAFLLAFGAPALLHARIRDRDPDFVVTTDDAAALAEACAALDGLPLALELAAPLVAELGLHRYLAQLHRRLVVGTGPRDVPARHRSLEATVEWSHELLSDTGRDALARLAVFAADWDEGAASAVDATAGLDELVRANLLQTVVGADQRWTMLSTIRTFARDRLADHPAQTGIRRAHAEWVRATCRSLADLTADGRAAGTETMPGIDRLRPDVTAAIRFLASRPESAPESLALAVELSHYCIARPALRQGEAWLRAALDANPADSLERARATTALGAIVAAQGHLEEAVALHGEAAIGAAHHDDFGLEVTATLRRARLCTVLGRGDESEAAIEAARVRASSIGDDDLLSDAIAARAQLRFHSGSLTDARADYQAALALAEARNDVDAMIVWLNDLALCELLNGDGDAAAERAERASALADDRGNTGAVAAAQVMLGNIRLLRGDLEAAAGHYGAARDWAREHDDSATLIASTGNLAEIFMMRGQLREARPMLDEVVDIFRRTGERSRLGQALAARAAVETLTGNLGAAESLVGEAESVATAADNASARALALSGRAAIEARRGELTTAEGSALAAHRIFTDGGDRLASVGAEILLGWIGLLRADPDEGASWFRSALTGAEAADNPLAAAEARAGLAASQRSGNHAERTQHVAEAMTSAAALGALPTLVVALDAAAVVLSQLGDERGAGRCTTEAAALCRRAGIHRAWREPTPPLPPSALGGLDLADIARTVVAALRSEVPTTPSSG